MFKVNKQLNYGRHHIEEFINNSPTKNVIVDMGAGHGNDLAIAKKITPNSKFYAIEGYTPNILHLKEQGFITHQINLENEKLPFDNESVDIIIANQILEHVKEIFWIWHEIARVLKVGGSVIVGVPNLASLHNRLLLFLGKQPSVIQIPSAHFRGFTKSGFLKFVNETSTCFSLQGFKGSNFYPFSPFIAQPLAEFFPNASVGIFFHIQKSKPYDLKSICEYPKKYNLETNYFAGEN